MIRLIVCAVCVAALSLGCGDNSSPPAGGSGGMSGTGGTGGAAGTGGSSGTGGSAGMGGTGGSPMVINGCIEADADDMTEMASVTITDVDDMAWIVTHQVCVRVSAGTEVVWQGNFTSHPLVGGVTGTTDPTSPITMIGATSGTEDASTTLDSVGVYPYFCTIHGAAMQGVIYVVE